MRITKRADLDIGGICNLKCMFCYYRNNLNLNKVPSLEELRCRMAILKKKGIDTIDITGGEPTVRKDLIAIIRMVKEEFGIYNICLITNGFNLADRGYAKEIVDAGVNELLFSIHGPDANLHDRLTGVEGSFYKVIKALDEAGNLGIKLRANTTVTSYNYDKVADIAGMLSRYKIENFNLIMFLPILNARKGAGEMLVKYSVAAPYLKRTIDEFKGRFKYIHIKYFPFCIMQGYEEYIMNLLQATYIPYEWDFSLRARIRRGELFYWLAVVAGGVLFMDPRNIFRRNIEEVAHDAFIYLQEFTNKYKPWKCRYCKYSIICSGVWNEYNNLFHTSELRPVPGKKILRPYHLYEMVSK